MIPFDAIFENGAFRPLTPLELPENTLVELMEMEPYGGSKGTTTTIRYYKSLHA